MTPLPFVLLNEFYKLFLSIICMLRIIAAVGVVCSLDRGNIRSVSSVFFWATSGQDDGQK